MLFVRARTEMEPTEVKQAEQKPNSRERAIVFYFVGEAATEH